MSTKVQKKSQNWHLGISLLVVLAIIILSFVFSVYLMLKVDHLEKQLSHSKRFSEEKIRMLGEEVFSQSKDFDNFILNMAYQNELILEQLTAIDDTLRHIPIPKTGSNKQSQQVIEPVRDEEVQKDKGVFDETQEWLFGKFQQLGLKQKTEKVRESMGQAWKYLNERRRGAQNRMNEAWSGAQAKFGEEGDKARKNIEQMWRKFKENQQNLHNDL